MATWNDLATQGFSSASSLFQAGHWRGAINRAYYAVYSKVTYCLLRQGVTTPAGPQGPTHAKMAPLLQNHLAGKLGKKEIARVTTLYNMRIVADYRPSSFVREDDARDALGHMQYVFRKLK
jgi:uncharacterized protein (UPF0332 family)